MFWLLNIQTIYNPVLLLTLLTSDLFTPTHTDPDLDGVFFIRFSTFEFKTLYCDCNFLFCNINISFWSLNISHFRLTSENSVSSKSILCSRYFKRLLSKSVSAGLELSGQNFLFAAFHEGLDFEFWSKELELDILSIQVG